MAEVEGSPTKPCPDCAEEVKIEASVCPFCGHRFVATAPGDVAAAAAAPAESAMTVAPAGATAPPPASPGLPPPAPGVPPAGPTGPPARRGPGILVRIVIAVAAVAVGVGVAVWWQNRSQEEAASVESLRSDLAAAGFTCTEWEADPGVSDTLKVGFCSTTGPAGEPMYFEVWSYADRPAEAAWVSERCGGAVTAVPRAYVWGDDGWVIGVNAIDPAVATSAARTVATGLGGTASPFVCPG